ncbi:MAG: alpha/beta fold hydrolase [Deltaproteobacteria bacterium]|nr:MAG: alpha/beta fold hydrolase [Deltaproteobacteria bacterium]
MHQPRMSLLVLVALLAVSVCSSCLDSDRNVQIELLQLQTSDGVPLNAALREPRSTRANGAVVMVHGYGGNFYSGIMSFLPEALASGGFATLTLNMRDHGLGPKKNLFEENRYDVAAGVDEMARRGHKVIFLYGHSMGSNRVLYYVAATKDPRIRGVILTGPPGNLFEWNARVFGREAATRVLRHAQELVGKGKGQEWILIDLGPLGKALYTAQHVVSLRGPATRSDPLKNIARVSKPTLIVHGVADRLADPAVADKLRDSAPPNSQVTVLKIPGANHRFRDHQVALEEAILEWLLEHSDGR